MKVTYYITTILIALSAMVGALNTLIVKLPNLVEGMNSLAYLPYLTTILGFFNLLGEWL